MKVHNGLGHWQRKLVSSSSFRSYSIQSDVWHLRYVCSACNAIKGENNMLHSKPMHAHIHLRCAAIYKFYAIFHCPDPYPRLPDSYLAVVGIQHLRVVQCTSRSLNMVAAMQLYGRWNKNVHGWICLLFCFYWFARCPSVSSHNGGNGSYYYGT